MNSTEYLALIPKVELHLHLEGSIKAETLLSLAQKNRVSLPFSSAGQFRNQLNYPDFKDFIKAFLFAVNCLREPEDFSLVAYQLGAEMARQNIRYAEITWTPQAYLPLELPLRQILKALNEGRTKARNEWGVEMRWIPDLVRSLPQPLRQIEEWLFTDDSLQGGIVALGLGGPEAGFAAAPFKEIFAKARQVGLGSNPHAGENAGAESVWQAINELGASRIGHGVRSIEDQTLGAYLADHKIALEVCPTSNLQLGLYSSYAEHPLRRLVSAGCPVTINSDDPVLFGTSLTEEYQHALNDCGLSVEEIEGSILTAIASSYLEAGQKKNMTNSFIREFAELRETMTV